MADEDFTSRHIVDVTAGFDAGKLHGKSVVVTGGASGLGEEMVRQFVKAGAWVTIGDIAEDRAASIVDELGKDRCTSIVTDVTSFASQRALFTHALSASPTKRIDIVIANAGISGQDDVGKPSPTASPEPEEPNLSTLQICLVGVAYTAKLAVHYLSLNPVADDGAGRGVLVMTASLAGYLDMPHAPQYGAAKWGVRGLMHSLRRTMPEQGLRVNMIAPWFVQTPILSPKNIAAIQERGIKFAAKEDAATAVLHLSAESGINGRTFAILPRGEDAPAGYKDLGLDDYDEGDVLTELQRGAGMYRR